MLESMFLVFESVVEGFLGVAVTLLGRYRVKRRNSSSPGRGYRLYTFPRNPSPEKGLSYALAQIKSSASYARRARHHVRMICVGGREIHLVPELQACVPRQQRRAIMEMSWESVKDVVWEQLSTLDQICAPVGSSVEAVVDVKER